MGSTGKIAFFNTSILGSYYKVAGFIAALAILAACLVFFQTYNSERERITAALNRNAEKADRIMANTIVNSTYVLNSIKQQIHDRDMSIDEMMLLLAAHKKDLYGFGWVNTKKQFLVGSISGVLSAPKDISHRDYITELFKNPNQVAFGKPMDGAVISKPLLPLGTGAFNKKGEFIGVLASYIRLQALMERMEADLADPAISYLVTYHDGTPIAQTPRSTIDRTSLDSVGSSGYVNPGILSFKTDYAYKATSAKYPYIVYVSYSNKAAASELLHKLVPVLLAILSIGSFMVLGLLMLKKRIVRPIVGLGLVAESIAGGNMNVSIPRNGIRETDALADRLEDLKEFFSREQKARITAEEENRTLERIMTAKTRQARNLVHDMRAHASIVITFADIISSNQYDRLIDPQYADYANDIRHSGNQILDMVNEMLDLEKARNGKLKLEQSQTDMVKLLEQTMRCFTRKAEIRGVGLTLEMAANMPELYADSKRLRRMVQNLISNSLKFTRKGGAIRVSYTLDEEDRPVIRVTDTGRGMTAEELQIALTEYGQVQHDDMEHHDSTGIGLPFVKQMMEEHGGHLEIESAPGKGTTVSMIFDAQAVRYTKPRLTLVKG